MIGVERTDFISVPVQDMERATRFYAETLGIQQCIAGRAWPELETGNMSLYLSTRRTSAARSRRTLLISRCASRTSPSARGARGRGVEFEGEILDTGVCHMAFFRIPTETP